MKTLKGLACVLIAAAFVVPMGVVGETPQKDWNLMIFWCADNNLEWTTEFSMNMWKSALTSTADVNILVLLDIKSKDGTWIYELPDSKKPVATWPEKNTSDPAVLKDFVKYCMSKYPAEKNFLLIADHGYAWSGICEDETDGDFLMTPDGLGKALREVKAESGRGVDLLAFDACNMLSIEVAYELRDAVPYIVGSETTEPYDGLPYKMFISDMVSTPEISAKDLAAQIVREYVLYYGSKKDYDHQVKYTQDFATISAVDTTKMGALGDAFNKLATVLQPLIPDHRMEVEEARGYALVGTWTNMAGFEWTPDVYTFVEGLRSITGHPDLTAAIDTFEDAFDDAVFAESHSRKYHNTVNGLNFWFPPSESRYYFKGAGWWWYAQFVYHESGLDLAGPDSPWVKCLMAYYGAE